MTFEIKVVAPGDTNLACASNVDNFLSCYLMPPSYHDFFVFFSKQLSGLGNFIFCSFSLFLMVEAANGDLMLQVIWKGQDFCVAWFTSIRDKKGSAPKIQIRILERRISIGRKGPPKFVKRRCIACINCYFQN